MKIVYPFFQNPDGPYSTLFGSLFIRKIGIQDDNTSIRILELGINDAHPGEFYRLPPQVQSQFP
ncbi:hypothetical protein DFP94_11245 [Fontibacillus phaseoli]|uniref:Uncharacterized protein n=1 Tax=Fontibacillus phaseoli TaxID=1416533 RepID=A0A369B525_9BACL|nr:hypothetical protein [Fontibacillus phaseoli]RCX16425.1 hypothetical protein DFP94_11245 [Fontibacillus phaseoli]